jgi:hypothetical protein
MITTPSIDSAMEEPETLAPLLLTEVGEAASPPLSPQLRAYKEALMTTRVLVEKLRVVRMYCSAPRPMQGPCTTCDGE